jgi:hypothetical protein
MKTLLYLACGVFSINCFGQTKIIAFKSHSGNEANFRTAIEHDFFDVNISNFGNPTIYVRKVDSVILEPHNKLIIKRGLYEKDYRGMVDKRATVFYRDTLFKANEQPLFAAIKSFDSLKAVLLKKYKGYKIDTNTVFVGFDKKLTGTKSK